MDAKDHSEFVMSLFVDISSLKIVDDYVVDGVRVVISVSDKGLKYNALEPYLSDSELNVYNDVYSDLINRQYFDPNKITFDSLSSLFLNCAIQLKKDKIVKKNLSSFLYYLKRNVLGYDILDVLIKDDDVADFGISHDDAPVTLLHRRHTPGNRIPTNLKYEDIKDDAKKIILSATKQSDSLLAHLAQKMGSRHLTESEPYLEGTLPSGARATLWKRGTTNPMGNVFTIRKPLTTPITITQLLRDNVIPYELSALIWLILDTSGGTGVIFGAPNSGKTTTTNALTNFINPHHRIFTVEDNAEFCLFQDDVTSTITKKSDPAHTVTYMTLFVRIMRLTPDFVCVGEVRLSEIEGMLHLFESGCPAIGTFHATDEEAAMSRFFKLGVLEAQLLDIGFLLGMGMISLQNNTRKVISFSESFVKENGDVGFDRIVTYDRINDSFEGSDLDTLIKSRRAIECAKLRGVSDIRVDLEGRVNFLKMLVGQKKFTPSEVKLSFEGYYNRDLLRPYKSNLL
mgnify:FL=1|jgi:archaeal flagellar protein FlaI